MFKMEYLWNGWVKKDGDNTNLIQLTNTTATTPGPLHSYLIICLVCIAPSQFFFFLSILLSRNWRGGLLFKVAGVIDG